MRVLCLGRCDKTSRINERVKSRLNPTLDIYGILLTMYDSRTTLSKQVVDEVREYFGRLVFATPIPRTV